MEIEKTHPMIWGHRGASAHAPENTLPAFKLAVEQGADGVELDVWRCGSGEVVVTHNQDLSILTGSPGNVENTPLDTLKQLDFKGPKWPGWNRVSLPTLPEVLEVVQGLAWINIEVKGKHFFNRGIEAAIVADLKSMGLMEKTIVSSFNPASLARFQKLTPSLHRGLLFKSQTALPLRRAVARYWVRPYSLHPNLPLLSQQWCARARKKNQKVVAWTINNIQDLDRCIRYGVDAMITDDPAWLRSELERR